MIAWRRDFYIEPERGQVLPRGPYVSEGVWLMAALGHLGLCLLVSPLGLTSASGQVCPQHFATDQLP